MPTKTAHPIESPLRNRHVRAHLSIGRTSHSELGCLSAAPHVKRSSRHIRAMRRFARLLIFMCFPGLLVGCALNDVRPLPTGSPVIEGRAIVVYGVGVERQWAWPRFAVQLEEYSVKRK